MAVTIGSNISALRTIRQLDGTTRNLASTSERLASGQRINRASDDAAGLAIASTLDATSRVLSKALANVNDGISLLSIADGAMRELGTILIRVKELATQSANGSYSSIQRRALDEEGQKLRDEYNRILATTTFNGVKLLDGSQSSVAIQAGSDGISAPLQLTVPSLGEIDAQGTSLSLDGMSDYVTVGDSASLDLTTTGTISAWVYARSFALDAGNNRRIVSKPTDGPTNDAYGLLTDSVSSRFEFRLTGSSSINLYTTTTNITTNAWHHVTGTWDGTSAKIYLDGNLDNTAATSTLAASSQALQIGRWAGGDGDFDGYIDDIRIYNRALDGSEVSTLATGGTPSSNGLVAHYDFETGTGTIATDISGNGNNGTFVNDATWASTTPSQLAGNISALETFSLLTAADARATIDTIESAFARLSGEVGKLGSQMSRLQTVINTIAATRENYQAAAGRIKDADVASESANLVRHQILQQTASGVLAQANQQPQIAIQLLGAI